MLVVIGTIGSPFTLFLNHLLLNKIFLSTILSVLVMLCATSVYAQKEPAIEWLTEKNFDFGDIEKDIPVTTVFKFKNNSEQAITIENVRTTCGCTAPDWQVEPILPRQTGQISIEYDAAKPRSFKKRILVFFNEIKKGEKLYISGYVENLD